MLLETKRLLIYTIDKQKWDYSIRATITPNGIFIKPEGLTAEMLMEDSSLVALTGKPIGLISIGSNGWIDYMIVPEYQGNGYATEALEGVKQFAFENKVEPFLLIKHNNHASIAVARKCGFKRVADQDEMHSRYYVM